MKTVENHAGPANEKTTPTILGYALAVWVAFGAGCGVFGLALLFEPLIAIGLSQFNVAPPEGFSSFGFTSLLVVYVATTMMAPFFLNHLLGLPWQIRRSVEDNKWHKVPLVIAGHLATIPVLFLFNTMVAGIVGLFFAPAGAVIYALESGFNHPILGGLLLGGASVSAFIVWHYSRQALWLLKLRTRSRQLPTSTVASAAIGLVELQGTAHPTDPNDSEPIIKATLNGIDSSPPAPSLTVKPFLLRDGSGEILVIPPMEKDAVADGRIWLEDPQASKPHFRHGELRPGDHVYVLGYLPPREGEGSRRLIELKPVSDLFERLPGEGIKRLPGLFILSNRGEKYIADRYFARWRTRALMGGLWFAGSVSIAVYAIGRLLASL